MARVLGVGGVFFKSKNPEKLGSWYNKWLGVPVEHPYGASFKLSDTPKNGYTVWTPFKEQTDYFAPSERPYMFNLIVDDVEGALDQVKNGGAQIIGEIDKNEYGEFGWFLDPEGNKVELWKP